MTARDFIATARDLARAVRRGGHAETTCGRVSTTYYALFQASSSADVLVGGPSSERANYADYDPAKTYNANPIRKSEVLQDILDAEDAIKRFQAVPAKDRRAFAIFVLLNIRRTR